MPDPSPENILTRFESLTEIGRALGRERDASRLLELILTSAARITSADGSALYRVNERGDALDFEIVRNETLGWGAGSNLPPDVPFPPVPLYDEHGEPNLHSVVAHAALSKRSTRIADAYSVDGFDFSFMRSFDASHGYRSRSVLTVPMLDQREELLGVVQLLNARDAAGAVTEFTADDQRLTEALTALAGVVLEKALLIDRLETLFRSFVNLINVAIDEKSPHTSGHCQRVPELTMMLAEAAHETEEGPLGAFRMTERDRAELWMAGLLHDCGKITTPVHVVDKVTKLQTIFDRIALVDARLEILARDARIRALERKLAGDAPEAVDAALAAELDALDADRVFLRRANVGQETFPDEDIARVRQLARRQWLDRDGVPRPLLTADEVENLAIAHGTLTAAERGIINQHIVSTIRMLESLPWPKHLRNVPEYAGGHHERMDGRGYPRGLKRDQMSWQARMMAIADIFEALTAGDRPYKGANTLAESLRILGKMRLNGHVDPDLFDVFVRRKVYLAYAQRFLDPRLIDAIDERAIPGYAP